MLLNISTIVYKLCTHETITTYSIIQLLSTIHLAALVLCDAPSGPLHYYTSVAVNLDVN
jgi:hypothetical protein